MTKTKVSEIFIDLVKKGGGEALYNIEDIDFDMEISEVKALVIEKKIIPEGWLPFTLCVEEFDLAIKVWKGTVNFDLDFHHEIGFDHYTYDDEYEANLEKEKVYLKIPLTINQYAKLYLNTTATNHDSVEQFAQDVLINKIDQSQHD